MVKKTTVSIGILLAVATLLMFFSAAHGQEMTQIYETAQPLPTEDAMTPEPGNGQMGTGMSGMGTSNCPMMNGATMENSNSTMSMSGMPGMSGMQSTSGMQGMGGSPMVSEQGFSILALNPWWLLGWVLLALVSFIVLSGAVVSIVWIVRRSRSTRQAQTA